MIPEDFKLEGRELTEQELNALYFYLSLNFDEMSQQEQDFWTELMPKLDKTFYDDKDSGTL